MGCFGTLLFIAVLWFTPWVYVLNLGVLVYRPYEPDGIERYFKVTGPLVQSITDVGWTDTKQIPKACRKALIASEDGNFYEHPGIDTHSIEKALERNEKRGKIKSGGSTITQQLVKNAFLSRDKTYLRKAREALGALLLDIGMDKKDQITWYFNVVEFGPNIYGINDAAREYFNRKPQDLSVDQCAQLVSILPSPKRYYQSLKQKRPTAYLQKRIDRIKHRLAQIEEPSK